MWNLFGWQSLCNSWCYLLGIICFAERPKILINLTPMPKPGTVLPVENMTMFYVRSRKIAKSSIPVHQRVKLQTFKNQSFLSLIFNNGSPCSHLLCHLWVLACRQAKGRWQNIIFKNFYLLPSIFLGMGILAVHRKCHHEILPVRYLGPACGPPAGFSRSKRGNLSSFLGVVTNFH